MWGCGSLGGLKVPILQSRGWLHGNQTLNLRGFLKVISLSSGVVERDLLQITKTLLSSLISLSKIPRVLGVLCQKWNKDQTYNFLL